jgi:hypothetical protein
MSTGIHNASPVGARGSETFRGNAMEHYSLEKWADFARQVVGEREKAKMQSHLEDGCGKCSKVLGLWQRVHQFSRHERSYQPPDSAVRSMVGTFAIRGPRKAGRTVRSIAELLFDSSRSPLPTGVRSSGTVSRQLLYGTGDYRIDVRIEARADSDKVAVVGQVLNSGDPDENVGVVPVTLVRAGKALTESLTSPFGEFDVECDRRGPFELRVTLPSQVLTLPLIQTEFAATEIPLKSPDSKRLKRKSSRSKKRTRKKV